MLLPPLQIVKDLFNEKIKSLNLNSDSTKYQIDIPSEWNEREAICAAYGLPDSDLKSTQLENAHTSDPQTISNMSNNGNRLFRSTYNTSDQIPLYHPELNAITQTGTDQIIPLYTLPGNSLLRFIGIVQLIKDPEFYPGFLYDKSLKQIKCCKYTDSFNSYDYRNEKTIISDRTPILLLALIDNFNNAITTKDDTKINHKDTVFALIYDRKSVPLINQVVEIFGVLSLEAQQIPAEVFDMTSVDNAVNNYFSIKRFHVFHIRHLRFPVLKSINEFIDGQSSRQSLLELITPALQFDEEATELVVLLITWAVTCGKTKETTDAVTFGSWESLGFNMNVVYASLTEMRNGVDHLQQLFRRLLPRFKYIPFHLDVRVASSQKNFEMIQTSFKEERTNKNVSRMVSSIIQTSEQDCILFKDANVCKEMSASTKTEDLDGSYDQVLQMCQESFICHLMDTESCTQHGFIPDETFLLPGILQGPSNRILLINEQFIGPELSTSKQIDTKRKDPKLTQTQQKNLTDLRFALSSQTARYYFDYYVSQWRLSQCFILVTSAIEKAISCPDDTDLDSSIYTVKLVNAKECSLGLTTKSTGENHEPTYKEKEEHQIKLESNNLKFDEARFQEASKYLSVIALKNVPKTMKTSSDLSWDYITNYFVEVRQKELNITQAHLRLWLGILRLLAFSQGRDLCQRSDFERAVQLTRRLV